MLLLSLSLVINAVAQQASHGSHGSQVSHGSLPVQPNLVRAKLGEIHFSALLGGTIGGRGAQQVLELYPPQGKLVALQVCGKKVIREIRAQVEVAGKKSVRTLGQKGESDCAPVFNTNSRIVGISGAGGWFIDSLRFHFADGTQSPLYGGKGGDSEFRLLMKSGEIRGLWGTVDGQLESIGLVFWPIE
jgi:hypothetical protein